MGIITQNDLKNVIGEFKTIISSSSDIAVNFDEERGSIVLRAISGMLFESGNPYPTAALRRFITLKDAKGVTLGQTIVKKAMALDAASPKHSVELRIEGHTDPKGAEGQARGGNESFMYNLELSSNRAKEIYRIILNSCGLDENEKEFVKKNMIAVGYSFATRVIDGDATSRDYESMKRDTDSRRIEFRIILK